MILVDFDEKVSYENGDISIFSQNKLGLCVYYNGTHCDALLPFEDNPQQFVPHFDLNNMSL